MIKKLIFQWLGRLFVPDVSRQMEKNGSFDIMTNKTKSDDIAQYVLVEDRGSDTTIFCYAGGALLYVGFPRFEFRRLLLGDGGNYNLVFFRDISRMGYHVAPDGQKNGLGFYETKIRELIKTFGSQYNVSVGSSWGGSAAFYFGSRCGMDKIVAFCPVLQWADYITPGNQLRAYLDLKHMLTSPRTYMERSIIVLGARLLHGKMIKTLGREAMWDVVGTYRNHSENRPRATIVYGAKCFFDSHQASLVADLPEVKLLPMPTARHNCAAELKEKGELAGLILNEIRR